MTVFDQCRVVAFEASTGKRRWAFQTKGWVGGGVQVTATSVFLGSLDTFLYCLDKKTGKETWKFEAKNRTVSTCVVDNQNVYFGTTAGIFFCLNQKDGKEVWRFKTDGRIDGRNYWTGSKPVLLRGTLWVTSHDGKFYGVAATSGKRLCMIQPDEEADLSWTPITDGQSFFLTTRPHERKRGNSLVAISLK